MSTIIPPVIWTAFPEADQEIILMPLTSRPKEEEEEGNFASKNYRERRDSKKQRTSNSHSGFSFHSREKPQKGGATSTNHFLCKHLSRSVSKKRSQF